MKILIDTNIYLDFYRSNNEALKLLEEMEKHLDKIIITDQIIVEFERSREKVIQTVKQNFDSESQLRNFSSSYLQTLQEFKDLIKLQEQYLLKRKELITIISESINSQKNDPVAQFFNRFVNKAYKENLVYFTTEEVIANAHKRKLVGNPPTTADKYSIGDEINWEIVLSNVNDDIIIVGRDNTYKQNYSFLQKDFHKHTGKYIVKLTNRITDALNEIGIATSQDLGDAENKMIEEIIHFNDFWKRANDLSS